MQPATLRYPDQFALAAAEPDHEEVAGSLEELERQTIIRVLNETGGDRARAAKRLGIGKTTIYRKLKTYGLSVDEAPKA